MREISTVLNHVFTREFFRVNAGFFLLVVGFCFGFLSGHDHVILARFFTGSPYGLIVPFAIWLLYAIKIVVFNDLALSKKENEFIYLISLSKPRLRWLCLLETVTLQLLPAIFYGIFLILIATREGNLISAFLSAIVLILLSIALTLFLNIKILNQDGGIRIGFLRRYFNRNFTRPLILMYPEWIARRQPVMVCGTKIFSCLILIGISSLYDASYDLRLFAMGCSLIFSFNLILIFHYHRFENFHFNLLRSLPISLNQRLVSFCLIWILLLIPEGGTIIHYWPQVVSMTGLPSVIIFGLGTGLLAYSYLFIKDITLEVFIQRVFVTSFIWIVLILFRVPVAILALFQITTSFYLFRKYFYQFEFNSELKSEK